MAAGPPYGEGKYKNRATEHNQEIFAVLTEEVFLRNSRAGTFGTLHHQARQMNGGWFAVFRADHRPAGCQEATRH